MIRLHILGSLDLRTDPSQPGVRRLLHQPKRVALLAYLAHRAAGEPVRRDTLLGLFWPEGSQESGRHALSQALYVLRHTLEVDLIRAVGQESIALDHDRLWCDSTAFDAALTGGDLDVGLKLYRGDLLEGFYLPGVGEFERWLDEERTRLRDRAVGAARALADREEADQNVLGAIRWARRTVELAPYDESAIRRLVTLLAKAGDRTGAHLEFQRFAERLDADIEIAPPAALVDLMAHIEQLPVAPEPPTVLVSAVGTEWSGVVPTPAPPRQDPVPPRADTLQEPSRPRVGALALLGGILLVAMAAALINGRTAGVVATDPGQPPVVLVAAAVVPSGDSLLAARARLVQDALGREIARTGVARAVAPMASSGEDPATALVLGSRISRRGAATVVEVHARDPVTGVYLFTLEPFTLDSAGAGDLQELLAPTMVAIAQYFDERLRGWFAHASRPRDLASHRRYAEALTRFGAVAYPTAGAEAAEAMLAVWRADTAFTAPLIWAMFALLDAIELDAADSIAHQLAGRIETLPEWDHHALDYFLADLHGQIRERYDAAEALAALSQDPFWQLRFAEAAAAMGCGEEALDALIRSDPRQGAMRRHVREYWTLRLDLRHLSGDPVAEAEDARLASRQLTDEQQPGQWYRVQAALIRAAAVAGDSQVLRQELGKVRSLGQRAHFLYTSLLYWGPLDLPADAPAKVTILDSAKSWYAEWPDRNSCAYQNLRFTLLYHGAEWVAADAALADLVTASCLDTAEAIVGAALFAAHRGDTARAMEAIAAFDWEAANDHYRHIAVGDPHFWRARLHAILGDPAAAVGDLRVANRRGVPFRAILEGAASVDFDRIRGYPPLEELLAPRACGA